MRGIVAALTTTDTAERVAILNREALDYAVRREIFSVVGGGILDTRTAVMVRVLDSEGATRAVLLMTGAEYDERTEAITDTARERGMTVEIIDGRDYTSKGLPRKRKRNP